MADEVIKTYGGLAFKELNLALNAWRLSWDGRKFRDEHRDGSTFSAETLPFWQLAKLFIVLHLVGEDNSGDSELKVPRAEVGDIKGKLLVQERVSSWLHKLRAEKGTEGDLGPSDRDDQGATEEQGSRVLMLMRPL